MGIEAWYAFSYEMTAILLAVIMLLLQRGLNGRKRGRSNLKKVEGFGERSNLWTTLPFGVSQGNR